MNKLQQVAESILDLPLDKRMQVSKDGFAIVEYARVTCGHDLFLREAERIGYVIEDSFNHVMEKLRWN